MAVVAELAQRTKTAVEKSLELAVFGNEDFFDRLDDDASDRESSSSQLGDVSGEEDAFSKLDDSQLFAIDGGEFDSVDQSIAKLDNDTSNKEEEHHPHAAWHDSDDDKLVISLASKPMLRKLRHSELDDVVTGPDYARRLRAQFERTYPVPDWARLDGHRRKRRRRNSGSSSESDEDDGARELALSADPLKALFRSSQRYTRASDSQVRKPGKLDVSRLRDANHQAPSQSVIQTVSFHPHFPLMLTGGYDRTLRVFHIDGKTNTPVASLHIRSVPIERAEFHPDGKRIFISGKRKYFHIWNLGTGTVEKITGLQSSEGMQTNVERISLSKSGDHVALVGTGGWVNILSANTGQWLDGFKVARGVSDLVWHVDGVSLTVSNLGSELWQYNVTERRVVLRWSDVGGMDTTKLALGGVQDRWLAVGSKSGIVNIYHRTDSNEVPKLIKTLKQLTTSIQDLQFSHDGQVLAMASRAKKDALKMVHLPSATVYQNWPTQNTPLGKVGAVAFSPGSQFAAGNEAGRVTLWNI